MNIANNVQLAAIAGLLCAILEHVLGVYDITIPPDVKASLPAAVAVIVAHVSDMITGENKPKQ